MRRFVVVMMLMLMLMLNGCFLPGYVIYKSAGVVGIGYMLGIDKDNSPPTTVPEIVPAFTIGGVAIEEIIAGLRLRNNFDLTN